MKRILIIIGSLLLIVVGGLIFYFVCGQPGDQIGAAVFSGALIGTGGAILLVNFIEG